jgi:hypothetical protein
MGESAKRAVPSKALLDAWDEMGCLVCPFCGETEFDRIGLKNHLERHCSEWMVTPPIDFVQTREASNMIITNSEANARGQTPSEAR